MLVTAENLTTESPEPTNLTLFSGSIGEFVQDAFGSEFDSFEENYLDSMGEEIPKDWFDKVTWSYDAAYKDLAKDLPDILVEAYPDLFTTDLGFERAPVIIGDVGDIEPHDAGGWGREVVMSTLSIDGKALKALAEHHGITDIHDGKGIDGFIRTADDSYWSQIQVINELMEAIDDSGYENLTYTLEEWAQSDGRVGGFVNYPEELLKGIYG